jgi:hypothetical protein
MHHAAVVRSLVLLGSLLVLAAGCHGTHVEEAEHHTPAHKPADYPAAVDRLLVLHVEINSGRHRASEQIDAFVEAHDIVRWLPDLAADSDLSEKPWNAVYSTAQQLEAILMEVQSQRGDNRSEVYMSHETAIDQHHRALVEIKQQFPASSGSASDHWP